MAVLDEANRLAAAGQQQAAVDLVRRAASAGDAEALFAMANWRLFGIHGSRDLKDAHRLLDRARGLGHVEAARLKATLIGNGTGGRSDLDAAEKILRKIRERDQYANIQLTFSERVRRGPDPLKLPSELLSEAPYIKVVRGLLTQEECNYLMTLAKPELRPSFVIDPRTGARIPHPVRTSKGMSFGPTLEDRVVHLINRRIAKATGTRVEYGEPLHMLQYGPGEEYKPHFDALPGEKNQRTWTVLTYLNDGYEGGATRFDVPGIDFRGNVGDALIFRNADEEGNGDPATRHAGLPVIRGVKWLATRWIRAGRYHPWTDAV